MAPADALSVPIASNLNLRTRILREICHGRALGLSLIGFWSVWAAASVLMSSVLGADLTLNGALSGRVFEGLGAVSAGASSRLLIDYPPQQRAEILDFLFKPGFGASLQHLKVEIGGDINSTDGTEPSHERVKGETNFSRGWEWWLIQEAKARNPNLILDALPWGAPGWIGEGNFYSQDMIDYLLDFLDGAKRVYGIEFNYLGIRNEQPYDADWIIALRQSLDSAGWTGVRLVAADEWDHPWSIASYLADRPEFFAAVDAIGVHYPHGSGDDDALALGKPLWASEDGTGGGTGFTPWQTARSLAQTFNRNYTDARITKTEIWSAVTSYYDSLPFNDSGLLRANTPWSGFYEVLPAIWVTAHTTQFAQPGWVYLDGDGSTDLEGGGSIVTLQSPDRTDLSIVVETMDAPAAQHLLLHTINGIPLKPLALWRTRNGDAFSFQGMIPVEGDGWQFTAEPDCVYTLSTTSGQFKGTTHPPSPAPLGFPYSETFESPSFAGLPFGFMDQAGAFEVVPDSQGTGKVLRQQMIESGIEWNYPQMRPFTIVGDSNWTDYSVNVRVRIPESGEAALLGRVGKTLPAPSPPNAYALALVAANDGTATRFELRGPTQVLASGALPVVSDPSGWHSLRLQFRGSHITGWIDGAPVAEVTDTDVTRISSGRVGVGSGWNIAEFDDLQVRRLPRSPSNLALQAAVSASSAWDDNFMPNFVNDGDPSTRWNSGPQSVNSEWIEIEFSTPTPFNRLTFSEFGNRIQGYVIESREGLQRTLLARGTTLPEGGTIVVPTTTSKNVRLTITAMTDSVSLYEFGVYADPTDGASVQVSEWMLHNSTSVQDPRDGAFKPWFELWNYGGTASDLSGFLLSNDSKLTTATPIPNGTVLQPGERRIVWCGSSPTLRMSPDFPTDLSVSWTPTEQQSIGLYTPSRIPLSVVELDRQAVDQSSGIADAGSDAIQALFRPTPRRANTPLEGLVEGRGMLPHDLRLQFRGNPFTPYAVLGARSPAGGPWSPIATLESDADGAFQVILDASDSDFGFFRAEAR